MFQNFLFNFKKNIQKVQNTLKQDSQKMDFSKIFSNFMKKPLIKKVSNVNSSEYNQMLNFFKQDLQKLKYKSNTVFKKYQNVLSEKLNLIKITKPKNYLNFIKKKSFFSKYDIKSQNEKIKNKFSYISSIIRNSKSFGSYISSFSNKKTFDFEKLKLKNISENLKNELFNLKNLTKRKFRILFLKIALISLSIILIIRGIKYSIYIFFYGNSSDDKYDRILKSLEVLQQQNEELRRINQKLLEANKK